jgi:hypothetical protein
MGQFDNSQLSDVRHLELFDNSDSFRHDKELETVKC